MLNNERKKPIMNTDQVKGNWKEFKGKVKSKWGKLTDDEVDQTNGEIEQLAGRIQASYGTNKEEAKKELTKLRDSIH